MSGTRLSSPPKSFLRFLHWFCNPAILEDVEGDLHELYDHYLKTRPHKANILFARDVLLLFRPGILREFKLNSHLFGSIMLKNNFIAAIRHAYKFKGYTSINLLGLVVGIASSMLILLWIGDEVSMDKFHDNIDRIYQVHRNVYQSSGEVNTTASIPQPLAVTLVNDYPEVDQVVLLSWEIEFLLSNEEKVFYEKGRYASDDFFELFTFPLIVGDPHTVLNDPYSIVISESLADKYLGPSWRNDEDLLTQTFKIDGKQEFVITGVFKNPGPDTSLKFNFLLPAKEYIKRNSWVESWFNGGFNIYLSHRPNADIDAMEA